MRVMNFKFGKFATYIVLAAGLSAGAFASIHSQSRSTQHGAQSQVQGRVAPSIVGLWDIRFVVGGQTIQEAYQLWNIGGTEIHNPNVDPRSGNVCLGVWRGAQGRLTR